MCISYFFFFQKVGRPHQLQLDSEFLWAKNLFRAVISLCLKHAFLKRSVPLNVAKAAINELIILNLLAKCYSYSVLHFNHSILHGLVDVLVQVN